MIQSNNLFRRRFFPPTHRRRIDINSSPTNSRLTPNFAHKNASLPPFYRASHKGFGSASKWDGQLITGVRFHRNCWLQTCGKNTCIPSNEFSASMAFAYRAARIGLFTEKWKSIGVPLNEKRHTRKKTIQENRGKVIDETAHAAFATWTIEQMNFSNLRSVYLPKDRLD